MGCSSSRIEDEDVLLRCRERKRFIKLAIEKRYALAAAHVAYIQALRRSGLSLREFAEAEMKLESSASTSSAMTFEPAIVPEKSPPPSSFASSSSLESHSQSPLHTLSPRRAGSPKSLDSHDPNSPESYSSLPHMNYMRSKGTPAITVEERPPSAGKGTLESFSSAPTTPPSPSSSRKLTRQPPSPPAPASSSWDFFTDYFPFMNNTYPDQREVNHWAAERDVVDLEKVREDEGIPDLEDGDQGQQGMKEEMEQVQSEKKTSAANFVDPHIHNSEIEGHTVVTTGTFSQERVAGDACTQGPSNPSVEAMARPTSISVGEANEAVDKRATDKAIALGKNKEVADNEAILKNEQAIVVAENKTFLDDMKEIESWFLTAYESGKEVSKMLEANQLYNHSNFSEKKGRSWTPRMFFPCNIFCYGDPGMPVSHGASIDLLKPSSRLLELITWHRTTSSQSSSSKIPFVLSLKDDIDDSSSDYVENPCMISGSHASTLERLYAWEKKLYDEVKAEECIRRAYERKCEQLKDQEAKDENPQVIDKTRATIKDLHSRIRVAIQAIESVSERIQRLRDDELQPQLLELIEGMIKMWVAMHECHQAQCRIIGGTSNPNQPVLNRLSSESYRETTVHLANELQNWHLSFNNWIGAQKAYVQALHGWLQKCILENPEVSTKRRQQTWTPRIAGAPLVVIVCTDWSSAFDLSQKKGANDNGKEDAKNITLSEAMKKVGTAISNLSGEVQKVLLQQEEHQYQKMKKVASIQRLESNNKAGERVRLMEQTDDSFFTTFQDGLTEIFKSLACFVSMYKNSLESAKRMPPLQHQQ